MNKICKLGRLIGLLLILVSVGLFALDNMPTANIDIGIAATQIAPANYTRTEITLYNDSDNRIYIDNSLTDCTTNSFVLESSGTIKLEKYQGELWGIVDVTTSTLRSLELQY